MSAPRLHALLPPLAAAAGTLVPLAVALVLSGLVLALAGVDPVAYYRTVIERGLLSPSGLQSSLTRMAPLLLIAASLILAFRAGIWNLGGDGQFLLGATAAAAVAPPLAAAVPLPVALAAALVAGAAAGAVWSLVPALLRACHGINEIITTLMMSFLGASLANVLVKLVFLDPATTVPQTRTLAVAERLPRLGSTTVTSGLLIGLVLLVAVHFIMTRTATGFRLRVVGASPRAARHAGLAVPRLTAGVFAASAALAGLAGAVEVVGIAGNVRADWNPAYGLVVVPLVFLARLNGLAAIGFVALYSVLAIGGESAARRLGVPNSITLVVLAVVLITLAVTEAIGARRRRGS